MADQIIKSPLKYQGAKTKLIPWIKEVAKFNPEKELWVEPFMGSGVVGLNMKPQRAFMNDINPHVINLFKMMNQNNYFVEGMKGTLSEHDIKLRDFDADYYYKVRDIFNEHQHPNSLLFLNHTCFNGVMRFNQKGKFNVPYGKNRNKLSESYIDMVSERMITAKEITKDWKFFNGDYKYMFDNVNEDTLIYLDPPYIDRENNYFGGWGCTDECNLHELVMSTEARVVLSTWYQAKGETNKYVTELWGDLNLHTKEHRYSVGQSKANRYPVIEALLTNF